MQTGVEMPAKEEPKNKMRITVEIHGSMSPGLLKTLQESPVKLRAERLRYLAQLGLLVESGVHVGVSPGSQLGTEPASPQPSTSKSKSVSVSSMSDTPSMGADFADFAV